MIDLDAIKARLAAATPGPWYVDGSLRGVEARTDGFPVEVVAWTMRADAVLIAHAPGDIAALLAEVERLRAVEADAERARVKADLWSYYEALASANGAEGIAQLVVQRDDARAEVERLRAGLTDVVQIVHDGMGVARAAGRDEERAAVVAWLRVQGMAPYAQSNLDYAATMIERGEHRREDENRCPYCGALGEPNGCADCAAEAYERGTELCEEEP